MGRLFEAVEQMRHRFVRMTVLVRKEEIAIQKNGVVLALDESTRKNDGNDKPYIAFSSGLRYLSTL